MSPFGKIFRRGCPLLIVLATTLLVSAQKANAEGKLDMLAGYYSLQATGTTGAAGARSGPGAYTATYHYGFIEGIDFSMGYSLFFSNMISGDIGYGPDLGFTYYPFTRSAGINLKTERIQLRLHDQIRPLVNISFNQRQFQSVQSTYAGFSFGVGSEYHWSDVFDLKGIFRYQNLIGPGASSATYMDFLAGVSFGI
jgi:hypothetical protein